MHLIYAAIYWTCKIRYERCIIGTTHINHSNSILLTLMTQNSKIHVFLMEFIIRLIKNERLCKNASELTKNVKFRLHGDKHNRIFPWKFIAFTPNIPCIDICVIILYCRISFRFFFILTDDVFQVNSVPTHIQLPMLINSLQYPSSPNCVVFLLLESVN